MAQGAGIPHHAAPWDS